MLTYRHVNIKVNFYQIGFLFYFGTFSDVNLTNSESIKNESLKEHIGRIEKVFFKRLQKTFIS